jgi:hypothetical protein
MKRSLPQSLLVAAALLERFLAIASVMCNPVVFQRAWSDKPDKGIPPHLQPLERTANIQVDPRTP